jgi:SAM-dependent methyltransferase
VGVFRVRGRTARIHTRERALRAWFTRNADPVVAQVDGLDIGWGGVQRWATRRLALAAECLHLDFACGYGTFLAQLGWRFPAVRLVGLNIDFAEPHALAGPLLAQAGVEARLVQADARFMPFPSRIFDSVSCFLGLQDIEIGFGEQGVQAVAAEAARVLRPGGILALLDEFRFEQFDEFLKDLPIDVMDRGERQLDVRWDRAVALTAARLYAEGWVAQMRLPEEDDAARSAAYCQILSRIESEAETQIAEQGYYVPFGPVRMVVARKKR